MPSNRNSNAAKKTGKNNLSRGKKPAEGGFSLPKKGSAAYDIMGVLIIVIAIAMIVALFSNSSAPVTHAVGEALRLLFGVGALLVPVSIILFAATFFVDDEGPIGSRVAGGLALVVFAVLGILSINMLGAEATPLSLLEPVNAQVRGGLAGGGIAWCLLVTVGRVVGNVILGGVVLAGGIVCGFSVSDAVASMRDHIDDVRDNIRDRRDEREVRRSQARAMAAAQAAQMWDEPQDLPYDADDTAAYGDDGAVGMEPATSFLGSRKTSVLTRKPKRAQVMAPVDDQVDEKDEDGGFAPVTQLLNRRGRKAKADAEAAAQPVAEVAPATAVTSPLETRDAEPVPVAAETMAIPDFLQAAAAQEGSKKRGGQKAPAKKRGAKRSTDGSSSAEAKAAAAEEALCQAKSHAAPEPKGARPGDSVDDYELPPFSMLASNPNSANAADSREELDETKERLQATLVEFGLTSRVVDYVSGPIVTTFRIEMGEGERVNKIKNLEDDIALTLAAEKVRIFAPIRGTSYVGIEIPNKTRSNVRLGDVLPFAGNGPLEVAIGRDSAGKPVIADIARMPHMLVAGTTGSGKSVMINSMIMSLLMRTTPKQVRMIMIDPKRVEFSCYNGLPHLYVPVVTEPRQAASALQWAVSEMERRLKVFERAGARNIGIYNDMCVNGKLAEMDNPPEPLPFLVVVIDELSDLMMVAGKDVEASIVRIAQLARAAGIHLVIATQRPSANVVTGLIKSNIDSRIALKVSSGIDSRVILDETGAERLLGNGDMLFKDRGLAPRRVLGCYTSDEEIEEVVSFIREQGEPDYHEEILSQVVPGQPSGGSSHDDLGEEDDPLVWEAARIVVDSQLGSTSGLQRRLKVGYARAGRIMDMLEAKGVVGPPDGSKPREVLLDKEALEDLMVQEERFREV